MWGSSSSSFQQTHCIVVCPVDRRSPVLDDDKSYCFSPKKRGEETHSVQQKPQKSYVPWNECTTATTGRLLWHQRDHLLMDKGGNWFLGRRRRPARRPQMSSRTQVHHYSLCHSTLWSVKSKLHFLFSSFKLSIFFLTDKIHGIWLCVPSEILILSALNLTLGLKVIESVKSIKPGLLGQIRKPYEMKVDAPFCCPINCGGCGLAHHQSSHEL